MNRSSLRLDQASRGPAGASEGGEAARLGASSSSIVGQGSSDDAVESDAARFGALIHSVRGYLDGSLAEWLKPRVEAAELVSDGVGAVAVAVRELALRGGKRMRAALVVAGYEASQRDGSVATPTASTRGDDAERAALALRAVGHAAIAIELLQVYLLVHDDWMDDDEVRRGGPSVHVVLRRRFGSTRLGDAAAILAGDLACGYAQEALLDSAGAPDRVVAAARELARIQAKVVSGQIAEMTSVVSGARHGGDGDRASSSAKPSVETVHALKTASYTVTGPLALGARLGGATSGQLADLERYGLPLGIAFQLRDDLLGAFGDPAVTGKPVGNDIRQGKRTALVVEAERDPRVAALLAGVLGHEGASDADVQRVLRALEECGARTRVEARIDELLSDSRAALRRMALSPVAKAWLSGALTALGARAA